MRAIPSRETIAAMRHIALVLLLAACSGNGAPVNADAKVTIDPAVAHEIVDCDTASWQVAIPGLPDGYKCERACQVYAEHTGPSCASKCADVPSCQTTFDYEGLVGCCYGGGGPFVFCECQ